MKTSLVSQLKKELEETLTRKDLPGLSKEAFRDGSILRLVERISTGVARQAKEDQVLASAIRLYQSHPGSGWSVVLLNLLAPTLAELVERYKKLPPSIELEDLEQQVVLEALAAASKPLPEPAHWLRRHLELHIASRLDKWLAVSSGEESGPIFRSTSDKDSAA